MGRSLQVPGFHSLKSPRLRGEGEGVSPFVSGSVTNVVPIGSRRGGRTRLLSKSRGLDFLEPLRKVRRDPERPDPDTSSDREVLLAHTPCRSPLGAKSLFLRRRGRTK